MPQNRFYYPEPLLPHQKIFFSEKESRHIQVFRLRKGDPCEIVNGKQELAQAILLNDKIPRQAEILSVQRKNPPPSLILALGNMKASKLEWIFEKGCELGVTSFFLFEAQNSEKKELSPQQEKRLKHLLIAALKQCGRWMLPSFSYYPCLSSLPIFSPATVWYGEGSLPMSFDFPSLSQGAVCLIGPEKGFTSEEIHYLKTQREAKPLCLSLQTLRAETAAITAAALLAFFQAR